MTAPVYFNDSEPFVCDWLENLIREKLLPAGVVDRRPIQEVEPRDVHDFAQCHFFAGIGGWAYALQLAGWGDRPVWTGSCPCQPFSAAGKRGSHADERHLWPAWFRLIRECHPVTIFGEQVSGAAGLGWLDAVALDLEAINYAVGASVLGAHSVGAPHLRQRLYFVANAAKYRYKNAANTGRIRNGGEPSWLDGRPRRGRMECMADAPSEQAGTPGFTRQPWDAVDWLPCRDGKARPVEPGTFPLAHGIPARVGRLRAYGNAIVPQVAAAFIEAYLGVADV
jgi:DNA (cytosine-5)-methyltransferase 1